MDSHVGSRIKAQTLAFQLAVQLWFTEQHMP